ncbi:MAG TPA: histidinol-phosphate transaminase [Crenotrichaceae bacterium]|nr:histidinol-phosphate transaminase [Crenotrichaceae bacterium]
MQQRIAEKLTPQLLSMQAYHVPDRKGLIKLDAMENPYNWPPEMVDEWLDCLRQCTVNRYPDAGAAELKQRLRQIDGVADNLDLLLGNGSDELILLLLMAVAKPGATVLAPTPAFVMYKQIADSLGITFIDVPLRSDDFGLDMPAMRLAIEQHQPSVIFLAYPNNPTGNLFSHSDMLEILQCAPGIVVSDEAYAPFADASMLFVQDTYPSLLVMRTVSKLGLAGLRLGYLIGHPAWIQQLDKIRLPYNINTLTQVSAEFALSKQSVFDQQSRQIKRDREQLIEALNTLGRCHAFPSSANFVLFHVDGIPVTEVFESLKDNAILVKNLNTSHPLTRNCLRVTVGTSEQNKLFLDNLRMILEV